MSTGYRLIVTTNTRLWGAKWRKISLSTKATFFCPQRWPLWRGSTVFKIPWKSKIIMYTYMWLCSIFNFLFSFSDRRGKKRFVLNRVGADLQMFKSGCNNRGVAEVKDIVATEKRSQVARLVLWTFIHTFSGYLLNFRKIFSSGNVCWHRPGSHWMWQGFRWNFVLLGMWNW